MTKKRKKKLKISLFLILLILIIIFSFIMIYISKNNLKVTLTKDLTFEVNEKIKIKEIITNIENGSLKDEEELLDTSQLGKKEITINILSNNKNKKYTFKVTIVDNTKPTINSEDKITIYTNDEVDLLDYVTVNDNYDENVEVKVKGEYDNTKEGEYQLSYVAKDSSNNEQTKEFTLIVKKPTYKKMPDKTITTSKGYTLKIKSGVAYIDDILIVNKTYYLPENYTPTDSYNSNITDNCPTCLNKEVMSAFNQMKSDITTLNMSLWIASGYRSYKTQTYLYNNYVSRDGKQAADTYSARAGYSEHQTGLAFDVNIVNSSFANTAEGKWLNDNCYLYGFIIRYPKGKEDVTGYTYEPWHLRYVGKELAKKLYNDGNWLTIEEYFGITSSYE